MRGTGRHELRWLALAVVAAWAWPATGQITVGAPGRSPINVKDFGAVGDGKADDTEAIRKAFEAVWGRSEKYPGTAYYLELAPVLFPTGHYRISDAIGVQNTTIRGEGAIIEQAHADKDIFAFGGAWRMRISGLTFAGGRNHLSLHNPNLDTGMIVVEDCRFYGASGVAIDFRTQSTTLDIEDCVFLECMQVLTIVGGGDQTIMRDCWITSHKDMKDMAVIVNKGGRLTIENLCGVPLVNGRDQRWIDHHGQWLSCVRCRFGGEGGGFTAVVNHAAPQSYPLGTMVFIEDSLICAVGNNRRKCAVYCEEIPNWLVVRDCTLYVPEVMVRPDIDPQTYFAAVKRQMLRFDVDQNCNVVGGESPRWLRDPPCASGPPAPTLGEPQTRAALEQAVAAVAALPPPADEVPEFGGHRQQTDPAKYQAIGTTDGQWDLAEYMDGTTEPNGNFLAVAAAGDGAVLLRRRPAGNSWPHVVVRGLAVDLDRTPILAFKLRDLGRGTADATALKVVDRETQRMAVLGEFVGDFYQYRAFDLVKALELSGQRTLDLKFYYLGEAWNHPTQARTGDYILLQFLRFEDRGSDRDPADAR